MMSSKSLDLPCGLEMAEGQVVRHVEIRKLKGTVQRDVARLASMKNPDSSAIIEAVLKPSIVMVGKEDRITSSILHQMLLADRDWLLFEIRRHTWGDLVTLEDVCPECKRTDDEHTAVEVPDFDLSCLKVTSLGDDAAWWDGAKVVRRDELASMASEEREKVKHRVFSIEDDDLGVAAVFRYPTGMHQKAISKMGDRPIEALWKLMSMTCLRYRDTEHEIEKVSPGGLGLRFWDDVDMDVLDAVQTRYSEAMPGVDTQVEIECPAAGHMFETTVRAADFLFPGRRKRT